jgi:hypothetical protein
MVGWLSAKAAEGRRTPGRFARKRAAAVRFFDSAFCEVRIEAARIRMRTHRPQAADRIAIIKFIRACYFAR